eukprot:SAG31_NODE_9434_length_1277_cov_4.087436_1_plen_39_part_10
MDPKNKPLLNKVNNVEKEINLIKKDIKEVLNLIDEIKTL